MRRGLLGCLALSLALASPACSDDAEPGAIEVGERSTNPDAFPAVVAATATFDDPTWTVHVTLSSPYDSPDRYADAWRLRSPDGDVYAVRELAHHHANEQPFTRSLSGISFPAGVTEATVEGRDLVNGWGGATVELELVP